MDTSTFTQTLNSTLENYVLKSTYEEKMAEYDEIISGLLSRLEALEVLHPELTPDPDPEPNPGDSEEGGEEDEGSTTV